MLGVSPTQVRQWIDAGLLPTVKFPSVRRLGEDVRRVLVAVDDLAAFVERHRHVHAALRRWDAEHPAEPQGGANRVA